jgi:hypothetical protein
MAFYAMEPFGEMRGDLQAGIVASTVVNMFGDRKGKAVNPGDFVLFQDKTDDRRPKTGKELYQQFRSWAVGLQ